MSIDHFDVVAAQMGPGGLQQFVPLVLIIVVFYFLLIRPQQKQAREHQQMVENLKKNDQVVTSGGLYGRIEDIQGDQLRLEIAPGVIVKHERRQISAVRSNKDK
jgi:preprotein translocase subunit YajC